LLVKEKWAIVLTPIVGVCYRRKLRGWRAADVPVRAVGACATRPDGGVCVCVALVLDQNPRGVRLGL